MAYYTPPIGQGGIFTLKEPFANKLIAGKKYTVTAIRGMSDLAGSGVDPFTQVYKPEGLTIDVFQADQTAGVTIITLEADGGNVAYIPNSYITGAPDTSGVPYVSMMLSIDLSIMPANVDLSHLVDKLTADVKDLIGVDAAVKTIVASSPTLVTATQAAVMESTRQAAIASSTTDYAQYLATKNSLTEALTQNDELTKFIIVNKVTAVPPTTTPTATP